MFCVHGRKRLIKELLFEECNKKFKSIQETYKMYTYLLAIGMNYPNPDTDKIRQVAIFIICLLCVPMSLICINDAIIRFKNGDMENVVRQALVVVVLVFVNMKSILTIIYKKDLGEIFHSISKDYAAYNELPQQYQDLVEDTVRRSKFCQRIWILILGFTSLAFPGTAVVLNTYSYLVTGTYRRFMVHECYIWDLSVEQTYSFPVFEIFFGYSMFIVAVIFLGLAGFDGMFSICMFHVSLKIKIIVVKLSHVMDDGSDLAKIRANIAEIVGDQCKIDELKLKLMKCYDVWLGAVFIISVIQIAMSLSQLASSEHGSRANIIFLMFVTTCAAHIFFPCYFTSDVTYTASLVSDAIYSCSWEDVSDPGVRRSVCFMIARAQTPMNFRALNLLTFDMSMFVSVLQTSYSMYTLLRE